MNEPLPYARGSFDKTYENLDTFKKSSLKMNLDYLENQKKLKGLSEMDLRKYHVVLYYSVKVGSFFAGYYLGTIIIG